MKLSRRQFIKYLEYEDACDPALEWIQCQPGKTPRKLWYACDRPAWLYWLVGRHLLLANKEFKEAYDCALNAIWGMLEEYEPSQFTHLQHKGAAAAFRERMPWEMVEKHILYSKAR